MEPIKKWYRNLSIKSAFVLIVCFAVLITIVFSVLSIMGLLQVRNQYYQSIGYSQSYYSYMSAQDEVSFLLVENPADDITGNLLTIGTFLSPLLIFVGVMLLAGMFFYRTKVKKPIDSLMLGVEYIRNEDLNFQIDYQSEDELGRLCTSFEKMRLELLQRYKNEWMMVEERDHLNQAFAHDVRTPVTIIKGHLQVLNKNLDSHDVEKKDILQTIRLSLTNLEKIERYLQMQTSLQKFNDMVPVPRRVQMVPFVESMIEDFQVFADTYETHIAVEHQFVNECFVFDAEVLNRILENVVINAVRYAKKQVTININNTANEIQLNVIDDGNGFSEDVRLKAFTPFFKDPNLDVHEHSGLGLYSAYVLTRKMGGSIEIMEVEEGAHVRVCIPIN